MQQKSKVVIRSIEEKGLQNTVEDLFTACDGLSIIRPQSKVVVKVNFCAADPAVALRANTSLPFIEAVCKVLKDISGHIIIGESDGMRHSAEKTFEAMNINPLAQKMGIKLMNFTKDQWINVPNKTINALPVPKTILDSDVFITLPLLKTHPRTVLTGALKNQWGCVPNFDRVLWHRHLWRLIVDINKICKPRLCLMDAITAMEGRGPCNGPLRKMNLVLGSQDPLSLDVTATRLIGLDPYKSGLFRLAANETTLGHMDENEIEIDGDWEKYKTNFEPAKMDWQMHIMDIINISPFLTKQIYFNPIIFYPLRKVMRKIRKLYEKDAC